MINTFEKVSWPCHECHEQAFTFIPSNLISGVLKTECPSCGYTGSIEYSSHTATNGKVYESIRMLAGRAYTWWKNIRTKK